MEQLNLQFFCKNIGEFSGTIIKNHLIELGILKNKDDSIKMQSIDFSAFIKIWRDQIGPKYYNNSILSIDRQIEIFIYISKIFPYYVNSKKKILSEKKTPDLTKPAWFAINPSDTKKGACLKIGFNNHGCDYWHKSQNNIGCYNCGFFIKLPENQNSMTDIIVKQFDYTIEQVSSTEAYDSIEFLGDGSFLNEKEVPENAQQIILKKISRMTEVKKVLIESRPEFINPININKLLSFVKINTLKLELAWKLLINLLQPFALIKVFYMKWNKN